MSDKSSFSIHLVSSQGSPAMSEAIAFECKTIARQAAEPLQPGDSVKAQLHRAWTNLGRPPFWRLRAAWYGEAGPWSAGAVRDFQDRFIRWRERRNREAAAASATKAALRAATEDQQVIDARTEIFELRRRLELLEAAVLRP